MRRLWVLLAVAFVDMMGLMLVAPLMPFYALNLGADEWLVGPLMAAFALAQLVSSPLWGRFSDRYGRRPALLIGLGASVIAYLVFAYATTLGVLFLSRIIQGLGGGTTGVVQAYVADTMAPRERAKALGWVSAATSAGVVLGPSFGSLAFRLGPEAPGIVAAAIVLVNLLFAWKWLPESRVKHVAAPVVANGSPLAPPTILTQRSIKQALAEVMKHPGTPAHRVIWIYVLGMLALNIVSGVLALYLRGSFGVSPKSIGNYFTIFGVVGVLMRVWLVGWVNERVGEVRTMRIGAACMALGLILMPLPAALLPAPVALPVFVLFMVFAPVGTALLFPASTSLVSQRAERHELGLVMGAQQTFRGVASIIGPIGATAAYDGLGAAVPFYLAAAAVAVASVLIAREPRERPISGTISG